jgi:hypothetical protein
MWRRILICGAFGLCGCSTLPSFDHPIGRSNVAPTVADVVNHIQCELGTALDHVPNLKKNRYVVFANLTLEVTDNQGLTPSLNFINPYALAGTNVTYSVNGQVTGQQHRLITQAFTLDLAGGYDKAKEAAACGDQESPVGLKGELGIEEIVKSGLQYDADSFAFKIPSGSAGQYLLPSPSSLPIFGTTIDFTVVYGLGGGPNWTITHLTGPSGQSGLFTLLRTDKDTLTLSFASQGPIQPQVPVPPPKPGEITLPPPPDLSELAAKAAQDNATRMILQRVLIP